MTLNPSSEGASEIFTERKSLESFVEFLEGPLFLWRKNHRDNFFEKKLLIAEPTTAHQISYARIEEQLQLLVYQDMNAIGCVLVGSNSLV